MVDKEIRKLPFNEQVRYWQNNPKMEGILYWLMAFGISFLVGFVFVKMLHYSKESATIISLLIINSMYLQRMVKNGFKKNKEQINQ